MHQVLQNIDIIFFLLSLLFFTFAYFLFQNKRKQKLPPGPLGFPILGYFPFLGEEPHLTLQNLSKKYGDIFGLYLGRNYTVVVKDCAILKDLLKQNTTSDRPSSLFKLMPGRTGFVHKSGPEMTEQRRYTIQKMKNLGFGVSDWEKNVQTEVLDFINLLKKSKDQPLDTHPLVSASVSNNVMSLVTGKHLPMGHPKRDIVDSGVYGFQSAFKMSGLITLFPYLHKIAVKLGLIGQTEIFKAMMKMNKYIRNIVKDEEHLEENSYIKEYKKEIEKRRNDNPARFFNDSNLVGNVQSLIIAGSDTTKVSLQWLFLAMASFPDVQDNIHRELDAVFENSGQLTSWQDRHRIPYCHATILEGQRWRTVAPLSLLHKSNQDVHAGEFVIPKGSYIIPFLWGIHMDSKNWEDPEVFKPERFLDSNGTVIKNIQNYLPFSFGKRGCIGETVAMVELFLYFVSVMQNFKIIPPVGVQKLKLKGHLGVTLHPIDQELRYLSR